MPSPLGHAIAGVAAGWLVAGTPRGAAAAPVMWREAALFATLGALPDVDLLVSVHRGPTHSLFAAVVVGAVAWLVAGRAGARRSGLLAVACAAAYGSHVLLDWLGQDTSAPIGLMALWPFTRGYYESDLHVFLAISRRYHQGWPFVRHNLLALVRELVILVPTLILIVLTRPRRGAD